MEVNFNQCVENRPLVNATPSHSYQCLIFLTKLFSWLRLPHSLAGYLVCPPVTQPILEGGEQV